MLSKEQVMAPLAALRTDEIVVTTMGAVRAWDRVSTHELDFANVDGAMGHAADLALGLALARPDRRVICLNGDGSMLMCLGTLATIAQSGVRNLMMVVLQNGTYEITGNQPVPGSAAIDYAAIAKGCGIERAYRFSSPGPYAAALRALLEDEGPVVVAVAVEPGHDGPMRRGPAEAIRVLRQPIAEAARAVRRILRPADDAEPDQLPPG